MGFAVVRAAETVWHIDRRGQRIGPVSPFELAYLARNRHLDAQDLIWCAGMPGWIEAGSVAGLMAPAEPPRAPTPQPAANGLSGPSLSALYQHYRAVYEPVVVDQPAPSAFNPQPEADASASGNAMLRIAEALGQTDAGNPISEGLASEPHHPAQPATAPGAAAWMESEAFSAALAVAPSGVPAGARRPLFGADIGKTAADAVIVALDKFELRTVDDLASDDQLRSAAAYAYDMLPGTVRFLVHQSIGRGVLEGHLVDMLLTIRNRIPPGQRQRDIRALVNEMAATPWLSQKLGTVYASTREGIGSMVSSYKPASFLPEFWRGTAAADGQAAPQRRGNSPAV